jgi:hypothetical protein
VVAGLLLVLGGWGAWGAWSRWRTAAYRRAALAEWQQLKTQLADSRGREAALRHLPGLVKRVALAAFPREAVASLSGEPWLRFLDRTGHTDAFTAGSGRALSELAYDPRLAAHLEAKTTEDLFRVVQGWIRHHSTPPDTPMTAAVFEPMPASADRGP